MVKWTLGRALALFGAAALYVGAMAAMKAVEDGTAPAGLFAAAHLLDTVRGCPVGHAPVPGSAPARSPTKM